MLTKESRKNQAEDLSIEYHTNLSDALEEAGKGPAAMYVHNTKRREDKRTLSIHIYTPNVNSGN